MKGKSFSSTPKRKRSEAFTLQLLNPPLFMLGSLERNLTSTSHQSALEDIPTRRGGLNDWENYLPVNDESTCCEGKANAIVGQRLTPLQNGLMVRVRW